MRRAVWLVFVAACGRLDFSAHATDGAVVPDAASDAMRECGATVLIQDGFDDGVPGPVFEARPNGGLTMTESNSALSITFGTVVSTHYASYRSVATYPLDGACIVVDVAAVPDPAVEGAAAYFKMRTDTQELELFEHGNTVDCRTHQGTTVGVLARFAWDPVDTRFWRLRQQAGSTFWDTSSDGVTWLERYRDDAFAIADPANLEIGAGAFADITGGGTASFAAVSMLGP